VPWSKQAVLDVRSAVQERYRVAVDLGAGCGLRQGEILGLGVDAVDFDARIVHIRRQLKLVRHRLFFGPPKSRKERDVPLPDSVAAALQRHLKSYPPVPVTLPWDRRRGSPEPLD
jgi:integrase